VIKSFKDKGLERFASKGDPSKLSVQRVDRLNRMLAALQDAIVPGDMDFRGGDFTRSQATARGPIQ